jgi:hypothetical protein
VWKCLTLCPHLPPTYRVWLVVVVSSCAQHCFLLSFSVAHWNEPKDTEISFTTEWLTSLEITYFFCKLINSNRVHLRGSQFAILSCPIVLSPFVELLCTVRHKTYFSPHAVGTNAYRCLRILPKEWLSDIVQPRKLMGHTIWVNLWLFDNKIAQNKNR